LLGNRLVLHVHGKLDVVTDAEFGHARHGVGICIGQRDPIFAYAIQFIKPRFMMLLFASMAAIFLASLSPPLGPGVCAYALFIDTSFIEPLHVIRQLLVSRGRH
jgi:hypothetical protein